MTAKPRATRVGFTMVELLVVIAIIAVLAALLLTAVGRVKKGIYRTTTTSDISQMEISIGKFKETFGFLPPSHVTISSTTPDPARTTQGVYRFRWPVNSAEPEFAVLRRMFPRWNPAVGPSQGGVAATWNSSAFRFKDDASGDLDIAWMLTFGFVDDATKTPPPAGPYAKLALATNPRVNNNAVPLDGNQVLVLMLGGPAAALTTTSYSEKFSVDQSYIVQSFGTGWDVATPTAPLAASNTKKGPHYDFPPSKLVVEAGALVPRVMDGWGSPYAYFTAAGSNYDPRVPFPWPAGADAPAAATYDGTSATNLSNDPSKATYFTAHAYGSNGKWLNPGNFQLVSAGPDKLFGPGSFTDTTSAKLVHVWDAKNPQGAAPSATYYGEGGSSATDATKLARGADDLCNFNSGSDLGTTP